MTLFKTYCATLQTINKASIHQLRTVKSIKKALTLSFLKKIGKGIAIKPLEAPIYVPFDDIVNGLFHSKHAVGSISELVDELLIYIGQKTVALEGKYFKAFINTGDKIKKAITHSIRYQ